MRVVKPLPYNPFECRYEAGTSKVFVNFGVVICSATNTLNSTFVPKINGKELKRNGDPKVGETNKLSVSDKGVICLDIELVNVDNYLEQKMDLWNKCVIEKSPVSMEEYLDTNFTTQKRAALFELTDGNSLMTSYFTPLINMTCPIQNVSIVFVPASTDLEILEQHEYFNFIIEGHKLVPMAYLNTSANKKLEQILDQDYVFCFPFFFDKALKQSFLESND